MPTQTIENPTSQLHGRSQSWATPADPKNEKASAIGCLSNEIKKPEYPPNAVSREAVARGVRPMGDAG